MRAPRSIVALLAVLVSLTATAEAGATTWARTSTGVIAGPLLSGGGAVWAQGSFGQGYSLVHGREDGTTNVLAASNDGCAFVESLAASATRVAAILRTSTFKSGGCGDPTTITLVAGPPDGPLTPLETHDGDGRLCLPSALDLDGDRLLVSFLTCSGMQMVIRDLATAGAPQTPIPNAPFTGTGSPVRLRGPRVAAIVRGAPSDPQARLIETADGHEDARIGLGDLMGGQYIVNFVSGLALDDDGTLVAAIPNYGSGSRAVGTAWTSPAEPTRHVVDLGARDVHLSIAGGGVAVTRADDQGVFDARTGQLRSAFAYGTGGSDFDGARVAWSDPAGFHAESFPHDPGQRPPPPAPPVFPYPSLLLTPSPAPPPARTLPPTVRVTSSATARTRTLTKLRGTASDPDGRVTAVAVAVVRRRGTRCEQLTRAGALRKIRRGCTATTSLKARGTTRWTLALPRRLPSGSYSITAAALDATGTVGSVTRRLRVTR